MPGLSVMGLQSAHDFCEVMSVYRFAVEELKKWRAGKQLVVQ